MTNQKFLPRFFSSRATALKNPVWRRCLQAPYKLFEKVPPVRLENFPEQVNKVYLEKQSEEIEIDIFCCTEQEVLGNEKSNKTEVEMDEMWSFYHDKGH